MTLDAAASPSAPHGAAAPPPAAAPGAPPRARAGLPPQPGLLEALQSILRELPGLVNDRIELLTLELQRAGRALAQIVALLLAVAILGVTAWLAMWVGIGVGLVEGGLHWSLSLLVVLALNAGSAWLAVGRMRRLLPLLRMPATRRHLRLGNVAERDTPADAAPAVPAADSATPPGTAGAAGSVAKPPPT